MYPIRSKALTTAFAQFHAFFYASALLLSTGWVWHSHHASTFLLQTSLLATMWPKSDSPLLGAVPTLSAAVSRRRRSKHVCGGFNFVFLGRINSPADSAGTVVTSASKICYNN